MARSPAGRCGVSFEHLPLIALYALGVVLLLGGAWILWHAQRDPDSPVDLSYLLVDSTIGKVTLAKFAGFGAFLASTWIFIFLPVTDHFDVGYASAYLLSWGAVKVAGDLTLTRQRGEPPTP